MKRRPLQLIPPHLVSELAHKHGIDKQARTFTAWSHVASLLLAQLTRSIGLNDVCATLRQHLRDDLILLKTPKANIPPCCSTF